MYRVICYFQDLQDSNHPYSEGDIFPRNGYVPSEARLKELSTDQNKRNKPFIEWVDEVNEEVKNKPYTKTEINRMSTSELKELANAENINDAEEMTGAELKKLLIEHFEL